MAKKSNNGTHKMPSGMMMKDKDMKAMMKGKKMPMEDKKMSKEGKSYKGKKAK